jgi:hypothetical protein
VSCSIFEVVRARAAAKFEPFVSKQLAGTIGELGKSISLFAYALGELGRHISLFADALGELGKRISLFADALSMRTVQFSKANCSHRGEIRAVRFQKSSPAPSAN